MESTAPDALRSAAPAVVVRAKATGRLLYIDNIRVFLTILVILHHLMVIYAGSGSWLYYDGRQTEMTAALGGWFCSVNQAYFMGLFLFISAYFVPGAYDRKGPGKFLADRLIRLGIPLAVYGWLLRPTLIYLGMARSTKPPFWAWYAGDYFRVYGIIGGGPLWFIEVLLIFSAVYVITRLLAHSHSTQPQPDARFPANGAIFLFALLMGMASFLVRLFAPVNDSFAPLNLQFANFCQYIALFVLGLVAYRRNWLGTLPESTGRRWLWIAIALIVAYPVMAILTNAEENLELFLGGWHWQALLLATWEALLCISMSIGLISLFRRRLDRQGPVARELSRSAYTAYLIHEPVISFLAVSIQGILIHSLLKFVLAALVSIPLCFALSSLIRRIPYTERVL